MTLKDEKELTSSLHDRIEMLLAYNVGLSRQERMCIIILHCYIECMRELIYDRPKLFGK